MGHGERLLHEVGGVHAGGQPRVEPQGDHAAKPLAVAFEQLAASDDIARLDRIQQVIGIRRLNVHRRWPSATDPAIRGGILQGVFTGLGDGNAND